MPGLHQELPRRFPRPMGAEWLTVEQVASLTGFEVDTVEELITAGWLGSVFVCGQRLIPDTAIAEFVI